MNDERVEEDLKKLKEAIENEEDPLQKMVLQDRLRKVEFWIEHGPPGTFEVNYNNTFKDAWNKSLETGNDVVNGIGEIAEEIIDEIFD